MSMFSQQKYQRQRMIKYAQKHSVTEKPSVTKSAVNRSINDFHGMMVLS